MNRPVHKYSLDKREKYLLTTIAVTSLGVFLFLLFFRPFDIALNDFNNQLLIYTSMGLIVFLVMVGVRIAYPKVFVANSRSTLFGIAPRLVDSGIMLILISVSFAFFIHYVGGVSLSIYVVSKAVLISLMAVLVLSSSEAHRNLRRQYELLAASSAGQGSDGEKTHKEESRQTVMLTSANGVDKVRLSMTDILLIRAADNYVDIIYREHDELKHTLLRNTINNMEAQLIPYDRIIRCHRAFIVNATHIATLRREGDRHELNLHGFPESVPVSRQYLIQVRNAMSPVREE